MGIYDRDYGRDTYGGQPGIRLDGPRSLTTNLVLVTVGVFLVQVFTGSGPNGSGWFTETFLLTADTLTKPWLIFRFLTYGFLHAPEDMWHIVFNMVGVWMFGRVIEQRYGKNEFLAFYLVAIVFAGTTWYLAEWIANRQQLSFAMLGASGGLSALLILFVFNFPRQMIYIWGILPLPAWAFGIFFIAQDMMGAVNRADNVAYTAHLGGALFGYLYYRNRWRLSDWMPTSLALPKRPTKLRIHDPDDEPRDLQNEDKLNAILKKISEQGQESLTWRERRFLEKTSQEYQRKRK